jgi:hypothetical protein
VSPVVTALPSRVVPVANPSLENGSSGTVPVAYIGGAGRSGSTLLGRILGQIEGFCSVGELVHLWERGVVDNQLCGCGVPFHDCPFWTRVGTEAFGGWEAVDGPQFLALSRRVNRHRFIPFMVAPTLSGSFQRAATAYRAIQERLYRAVRSVSGCRVVVDSSKEVPHALLLSGVEGMRISVVHLVRDSRGVAYSWQKRVLRPEVAGVTTFMPRHPPVRSAAEWTIDNLLFELLGVRGVRRHLLRYEALVADPRRWLTGVLRFLGWSGADDKLEFVRADHVVLRPTHSVSGNPMRFREGHVPLRLDEAWRTRMARADRMVVTAMTWPMLARYGYVGSAR